MNDNTFAKVVAVGLIAISLLSATVGFVIGIAFF